MDPSVQSNSWNFLAIPHAWQMKHIVRNSFNYARWKKKTTTTKIKLREMIYEDVNWTELTQFQYELQHSLLNHM
jgi:hypothetical protein